MADPANPEIVLTVDEVASLRERISKLEDELKKEREKNEQRDKHQSRDKHAHNGKHGARADDDDDIKKSAKAVDKFNEEMTRLTRGFFFAGLEAMRLSARVTREFVDKTSERSSPDRHDTWSKMLTDLPVDVSKAMVDAMKDGVDDMGKVVDTFYSKYKS